MPSCSYLPSSRIVACEVDVAPKNILHIEATQITIRERAATSHAISDNKNQYKHEHTHVFEQTHLRKNATLKPTEPGARDYDSVEAVPRQRNGVTRLN